MVHRVIISVDSKHRVITIKPCNNNYNLIMRAFEPDDMMFRFDWHHQSTRATPVWIFSLLSQNTKFLQLSDTLVMSMSKSIFRRQCQGHFYYSSTVHSYTPHAHMLSTGQLSVGNSPRSISFDIFSVSRIMSPKMRYSDKLPVLPCIWKIFQFNDHCENINVAVDMILRYDL